jgi:hypothetical protein
LVDTPTVCSALRCALVDVGRAVGAAEAHNTSAGVRWCRCRHNASVRTSCTIYARGRCAVVDVGACGTVAKIPGIARAGMLARPGGSAQGVRVAVIHHCGATVHHVTASCTAVACGTEACVRIHAVHTSCSVLTGCRRAVVYVDAAESAGPPCDTGTVEIVDSVDAYPVAVARHTSAFVHVGGAVGTTVASNTGTAISAHRNTGARG